MIAKKLKSIAGLLILVACSGQIEGQNLVATGVSVYSPDKIVRDFLFGGNKDVTIKNINYKGGFGAIGAYDATGTPFGTTSGMVLSTGSIYKLNGPNMGYDTNHTSWYIYNVIRDLDADMIVGGGLPGVAKDPAIVEFDITTSGNGLKFNFQYGSDEYHDTLHSDTDYVIARDAFGILIQGKGIGNGLEYVNLATVTEYPPPPPQPPPPAPPILPPPPLEVPINSWSVNNGPHGTGPCMRCESYYDNTKGQYTFTSMPGFTGVFSKAVDVIPCDTYHVKIIIADAIDTFFDSYFFLNIETANPPIFEVLDKYNIGSASYPVDTVAFEDCDYAEIRVERYTNIGTAGSTTLTYTGTAVPGTDYVALPNTVVFAPGQRTAVLQLKAKKSGSGKTVVVNNSNEICGNLKYFAKTYYLKKDLLNFNLGPDTTLCEGQKIILNASNNPPAEYYVWNDAKSGPYYTATQTGQYSVRARIGTCLRSDTINVLFKPLVKFSLGPDTSICLKEKYKMDPKLPLTDTAIHYLWYDNTITPTNTVQSTGLYHLKVTKSGCSNYDSVNVTVKSLPFVNVGTDTTFCYLGSPSYTILANTDPSNAILWSNAETGLSTTVNQNGNYWVRVKGNGCFNYDTVKVTMNQTPPLNLRDTLLCDFYPLRLRATPGFTYVWSTGSTDSVIDVTGSGTFSVVAKNGSCVATDASTVSRKPSPAVNLGNDTTLCKGEFVILDATYTQDFVSYKWGGVGNGCGNKPSCAASFTGDYIVTVTSLTNGCVYKDSLYFYAQPLPDPQLGSDTTMCYFKPVTIQPKCAYDSLIWGDGSKAATFTYNQPGDYWVKVYKDKCSNIDTLKVALSPNSPPFNLNHDTGFCKGSTVVYDLSCSNCTYQWNDLSSIPIKTFRKGGVYWITIDNQICSRIDTIHIEEVIPVSVFPKDTFLCKGQTITLVNPINGSTVLWDDFSTLATRIVNKPGLYSLTINQKGCKFSDTVNVEVVDASNMVVDLGSDFSTCSSEKITLDVTQRGNAIYLWSNGATTPVLKIDSSGHYKVAVTLCGITREGEINVDYIDNAMKFFMPNAFTPSDANGINDVLAPKGNIKGTLDYKLTIFNKWGQRVFESNDMGKGWDGTMNGSKLSSEVYFWTIDAHSDCYAEPYYHHDGNVTLLK